MSDKEFGYFEESELRQLMKESALEAELFKPSAMVFSWNIVRLLARDAFQAGRKVEREKGDVT